MQRARVAETAAAARPSDARTHNLLGAAYATLGHRDRARQSFEAALARDPHDPATYINLARLELESGNPRRAASLFAEALVLDATSETARQGLEEALRLMAGS